MNYPLGDFLIRFKNAAQSGSKSFGVPNSKLIYNTALCLKKMGYLSEVTKEKESLTLQVAYRNKMPVLFSLALISKPGLRIYASVDELEKRRKPSTLIISTPAGVVPMKEAIKKRMGGEVLVEIL